MTYLGVRDFILPVLNANIFIGKACLGETVLVAAPHAGDILALHFAIDRQDAKVRLHVLRVTHNATVGATAPTYHPQPGLLDIDCWPASDEDSEELSRIFPMMDLSST